MKAYMRGDLVETIEMRRPRWWQRLLGRRAEPVRVIFRCVATGEEVARLERE